MDYISTNHLQICIPGCEPVDRKDSLLLEAGINKKNSSIQVKAQKMRLLVNLIAYQKRILIEDFYSIGKVAMERREKTIKQFEKRYLKYTLGR